MAGATQCHVTGNQAAAAYTGSHFPGDTPSRRAFLRNSIQAPVSLVWPQCAQKRHLNGRLSVDANKLLLRKESHSTEPVFSRQEGLTKVLKYCAHMHGSSPNDVRRVQFRRNIDFPGCYTRAKRIGSAYRHEVHRFVSVHYVEGRVARKSVAYTSSFARVGRAET